MLAQEYELHRDPWPGWDVLCVDKTGTITEPHMEVGEVVYLDEEKYAVFYDGFASNLMPDITVIPLESEEERL